MKEDWAKRLNDKMAGFEEPVPSGLPFLTPVKKQTVFPWWWIFAATAAAAAVAAALLWPRPDSVPVQTVPAAYEAPLLAIGVTEEAAPAEAPESEKRPGPVQHVRKLLAQVEQPSAEESPAETIETTAEETIVPQEAKEEAPAAAEPAQEVQSSIPEEWERYLAMDDQPKRRKTGLTISFFMQNTPYGKKVSSLPDETSEVDPGLPEDGEFTNPGKEGSDGEGGGSTGQGPGDVTTDPGPGEGNPGETTPPPGGGGDDEGGGDDGDDDDSGDGDGDETPATKAKTSSVPKTASTSMEELQQWNHRFPIQLGVRLTADIGHGFGVETGLSYLRFLSTMNGREQELHYLGVPLRLRYNIYNVSSVSFYGSAGGEAMKCIAGNGPDKPWLFDADGALGVGFKLSQHLGMYAETGCGYYFHTGESRHYYTDHPFALSIKLGLNLNL